MDNQNQDIAQSAATAEAVDKAKYEIRPDVLNADDIIGMVPKLATHRGLVNWALRFLSLDKVNRAHAHACKTPGVEASHDLLRQFRNTLRVDNEEALQRLAQQGGAFITVSNHPFGALDGIALISLVGRYRPDFKVMVNMILNKITGMRPNFIAVDQSASKDPEKQKVSKQGIMEAIKWVRKGHVLGFFPAGAMSKVNRRLQLEDRPWRESVIRLIDKLQVPVLPIYFHGTNSWWFNFLGVVWWQARTVRLPAEVFRKNGKEIHISVGEPIMPEQLKEHAGTIEQLGEYLKSETYALRAKWR